MVPTGSIRIRRSGMASGSFTWARSGIIASAAAPTASNASRAAMSRYLPVESRLPVMAASHPDTRAPPTRGRRSTRSPAAISNRPTRRMNVRPSTGRRRSTSGLRYLSQSTKRLVNLSAPATMGTSPYPIRNSALASDGMLAPPTGRLRRRGGPGSPRGRLGLLLDHRNPQLDPAVLRPAPHGRIGRHGLSFESHCHRPLLRNAPLHENAAHGFRTADRELVVVGLAAGAVGEGHHLDAVVGVLDEHVRQRAQVVRRTRLEDRAVRLEEQLVLELHEDPVGRPRGGDVLSPQLLGLLVEQVARGPASDGARDTPDRGALPPAQGAADRRAGRGTGARADLGARGLARAGAGDQRQQ